MVDVLPAYAGMIPFPCGFDDGDGGAPRVCGDDPVAGVDFLRRRMCSPRMRG